MGLYEAAKDALKVAQSADNVELVQKLLDVQKMALDMQEKQQELQTRITKLENEKEALKTKKKYQYADGHNWMIDPGNPSIKLCPTCLNRDGFENPMENDGGGGYCRTCNKGAY